MHLTISPIDVAIIVVYMLGTIAFGLWVGRKQGGVSDYFLGDRNIPWWAILLSIVSMETSTATFLSVPGIAFAMGGDLRYLQLPIGYCVGRCLIVVLFLPQYFRGNFLTAYEVLHQRFGGAVQQTASLLFIVTRSLADGLRLYLAAKVLQYICGMDLWFCVTLMGTATIIYTFFGGMKSVVWTDVMQFGVYMLGAVVASWMIIDKLPGGMEQFSSFASQHHKWRMFDFTFDPKLEFTFWSGLIGGMFLTFGSHGTDQLNVQRYLCARSQRDAARAVVGSGVLVFFQFALFLLIGIGLACYFDQYPPEKAFAKGDDVFASFIVTKLPVGAVGLVIAAVFAAAMSTSLNSSAAAVINDFYLKLRKTTPSPEHVLALSRALTVIFGIIQIGVGIAGHYFSDSVVRNVLAIAGFTTGIILGLFFLGTLTKRVTQQPALVGLLGGLAVMTYVKFGTLIAWPWYTIIGSTVTFVAGLAASYVFPTAEPLMSRREDAKEV